MIEPFLADEAFLADVAAAEREPGVHVWWLGQSGFLVQAWNRHLLVDPYLSDSLTAKYAGTETPHVRMTRRVVDPARLSFVELVLATHGHTDHLDPETLPHVLGSFATLVCPRGIAAEAAARSGIEPVTLAEGEAVRVGGFRIEAVPADHPGPHCLGYVLGAGGRRIYHSGDTAALDLDLEPVDVALVPINGALGNMDGVEAARLAHRLGADVAVPCHYEGFAFNTASPDAFVAECERLGQPYRVLRAGERLSV